jgi:hypothetical protein
MKFYGTEEDYGLKLQPDETWNDATPQEIPEFTYWPFIMAIGLLFICWGIITQFALFILGLIIFFLVALPGWIIDLRETFYEDNYGENGSIDES